MTKIVIQTSEIMDQLTKKVKDYVGFDGLPSQIQQEIREQIFEPVFENLESFDSEEQKRLIINEIVDKTMSNLKTQLSVIKMIMQYTNKED